MRFFCSFFSTSFSLLLSLRRVYSFFLVFFTKCKSILPILNKIITSSPSPLLPFGTPFYLSSPPNLRSVHIKMVHSHQDYPRMFRNISEGAIFILRKISKKLPRFSENLPRFPKKLRHFLENLRDYFPFSENSWTSSHNALLFCPLLSPCS